VVEIPFCLRISGRQSNPRYNVNPIYKTIKQLNNWITKTLELNSRSDGSSCWTNWIPNPLLHLKVHYRAMKIRTIIPVPWKVNLFQTLSLCLFRVPSIIIFLIRPVRKQVSFFQDFKYLPTFLRITCPNSITSVLTFLEFIILITHTEVPLDAGFFSLQLCHS
jgi:hypothetical protein